MTIQQKKPEAKKKQPPAWKRALRWVGIIVGSLFGLLVLAVATLYIVSGRRLTKIYDVNPSAVVIPTDAESLAEGKRIAQIRGCSDCHGADLAGGTVMEGTPIGNIYATNLTNGEGGVAANYDAQSWVTAIRHGVKANGQPTRFMPSLEFYSMSDADVGALVAYMQSLPDVDNDPGETSVGPLGRMLWLTGQMPIMVSAELLPHDAPRPDAPAVDASADYGNYLAQGCIGCHTPTFKGGPLPGAAADALHASDLTSTGNIGTWTADEFAAVLRTGVRPDGSELAPSMPWAGTKAMTDVELEALYLFFQSLD